MGDDLPTGTVTFLFSPEVAVRRPQSLPLRSSVVRVQEPYAYPAKRRSTIDALCPPKPDEFETATPTSALRASFGT